MNNILLIEDDPDLGKTLQSALQQSGYGCTWANRGAPGLVMFNDDTPDLVLLDLSLPDVAGLQVLREIRAQSMVPVIILTGAAANEDKVRGLDDGADDYVTKPFALDELLARIRAQMRRAHAAPQNEVRNFGSVVVDLAAHSVSVGGREKHFTPTEFNLLTYLIAREGRAVSRDDLQTEVLQGEDSAEQALHTHISRIRRKLGDNSRHIRTVWGIGYRFDPSA